MKNSLLILLLTVLLLPQCKTEQTTEIDLKQTPARAELFGEGVVSTPLYERDMAISPSGDELIFTLADYKQSIMCLVRMVQKDGKWSQKELLPFSGQYKDIEPCFSVDGSRLYFASTRPMDGDTTRKDYNIWVSEKAGSSWGAPRPLSPVVNSTNNEFYPSVARNGSLYFTSVRKNGFGQEDIFLSRFVDGIYQEPQPLDTTINTGHFEFNAYVTPDEDLIVFGSFGRKDGLGGGDLYYSKKDVQGHWQRAVNMGPKVNGAGLDYCPFIDMQRGNFYFTSSRMIVPNKVNSPADLEDLANKTLNGMGNIYRIGLKELDLQ
ncbi:MAG: PD40 domain-containing protein [Bacteroidales bacterium]|nr:PD40 domain-containing protein [Bacteroidales bacterium]